MTMPASARAAFWASNRRRAPPSPRGRAAARRDHIAVDDEGALAEEVEPGDGAQGAADEALYFGRAPARAAPLAGDAGEGGARQHTVLGGDPAGASAAGEQGDAVLHRHGAEDGGIAGVDAGW